MIDTITKEKKIMKNLKDIVFSMIFYIKLTSKIMSVYGQQLIAVHVTSRNQDVSFDNARYKIIKAKGGSHAIVL